MTSPYQIVTPSAKDWDAFVAAHARGHILQLSAFAGLKRPYGWDSVRVALDRRGALAAGAQILLRRLPAGLGMMAYVPMAPLLTQADQRVDMWQAIDQVAKQHGAAFLKWEPGLYAPGDAPHDFSRYGFRESPQTIQPPRTIVIDISGDDDSILSRMNQGTRRKIRQSQKNNIRYFEASREDVSKFSAMISVTGSRNAFGVHEPAYYALAYDLYVPDHAALILAEHEGEPLAGIMVFALGDWAWYLYGASADHKRNLMAAYGVQWAAIQWAKARGCTQYDMWGIPDAEPAQLEAEFEQRSDDLWGVYGFKRGWGGTIVRSPGAWDKPYNQIIYSAYRLALRFRNVE